MKRLALATLFFVAGCATTPRDAPSAAWLVGAWLLIEEADDFPSRCASGLPIRYLPGGQYRMFEEAGSWRLSGDRLTETATSAAASAEPGSVRIGVPYTSRIVRIGAGEMRKAFASGGTATLRRCPAQ